MKALLFNDSATSAISELGFSWKGFRTYSATTSGVI